jgi:diaminopimelate decarboxylase
VVDRKVLESNHVVVLDGGVHHLLRPALVGQEHRIRVLGARASWGAKAYPVTVAGPLCSGLDVLASHAVMPLPEVGDLVAVLDAGAYGFTESMPLFLSHPIPAEVAVRGGEAWLIRPRVEPGEWLDRQLIPSRAVSGPRREQKRE